MFDDAIANMKRYKLANQFVTFSVKYTDDGRIVVRSPQVPDFEATIHKVPEGFTEAQCIADAQDVIRRRYLKLNPQ